MLVAPLARPPPPSYQLILWVSLSSKGLPLDKLPDSWGQVSPTRQQATGRQTVTTKTEEEAPQTVGTSRAAGLT